MAINVPSIVAQAIDIVAHQTISVTQRSGTRSSTTGLWTSGVQTTLTAAAAVTPARGIELLRLPEDRRNMKAIRIITRQAISSGDSSTGREADRITFNGRVYEAEHVQRWDGVFYDVIAVRTAD